MDSNDKKRLILTLFTAAAHGFKINRFWLSITVSIRCFSLKNYLAHFCIVFSILILVCFIILFGEFYVYRLNLWSSGQEYDIDSIESDIFNCFQEDIEVANVMNLSSKSSSSSEEIELHQIQTHVSSDSLVSFVFGLLLLLLLLTCTYN